MPGAKARDLGANLLPRINAGASTEEAKATLEADELS